MLSSPEFVRETDKALTPATFKTESSLSQILETKQTTLVLCEV